MFMSLWHFLSLRHSRFASLLEVLWFTSSVLPLVTMPDLFCARSTSVDETLLGSALACSGFSGFALARIWLYRDMQSSPEQ